jgi:uncharacterized protein
VSDLLASLPPLVWWQWTIAGLCAVLVGMAKTGVPGLGVLVVPVLFHAVGSTVSGQGVLLPLLCLADLFGVLWFRRHARAGELLHLLPWVMIGVGAGTAILQTADGRVLRMLVGLIVLAMVGLHLARRRWPDERLLGAQRDWRRTALFGLVAGIATTVANAAGPVMNLYLLGMQLPKDQFMGTGAWFFAIINLVKLPIYGWSGLITWPSLLVDALLAPGVLIGALLGKRLYDRVPQRAFETLVLTLTVIAGCSLLW